MGPRVCEGCGSRSSAADEVLGLEQSAVKWLEGTGDGWDCPGGPDAGFVGTAASSKVLGVEPSVSKWHDGCVG